MTGGCAGAKIPEKNQEQTQAKTVWRAGGNPSKEPLWSFCIAFERSPFVSSMIV